jgi:general secretion pathway protein H
VKKAKGFTLLELLVVLVIISLSSALVVPRLAGSMSNLNLRTACKRVAASLRYARTRAAAEKNPYSAVFDFQRGTLSIADSRYFADESEDAGLEGPEKEEYVPKTYLLPPEVILEQASRGELKADSGSFEVTFFPSGSCSGGEIILANKRGRRYTVSVDFITGSVRVREGAEEGAG